MNLPDPLSDHWSDPIEHAEEDPLTVASQLELAADPLRQVFLLRLGPTAAVLTRDEAELLVRGIQAALMDWDDEVKQ